jgi:hypothetical protein
MRRNALWKTEEKCIKTGDCRKNPVTKDTRTGVKSFWELASQSAAGRHFEPVADIPLETAPMHTQDEELKSKGKMLPLNLDAAFRIPSIANSQTLAIRLWGGLLLLGVLLLALTAHGQQDDLARLIGRQTPPQVLEGSAKLVSHYSPEQKLRLVLAVKPPHMAEEERFLQELQTKGSPNFHAFLTPEQWNERFAPSAEDEQKVVDWARSQGLTVTNRFPNRLLVDLEAPAGTIEKAFGVTINNYRVGDEVDFSNDRDPVLPESLSGLVYSVQGLNNIQRMHSSLTGHTGVKGPDYIPGPGKAAGESAHSDGDGSEPPADHSDVHANITNNSYDPTDIYSSQAYDYAALSHLGNCCNPNNNPGGSPRESSIALATFGTSATSDLQGFFHQYPYLAYNYSIWYIDGQPSCCDDETTLDTEWSIATSNNFHSWQKSAHVWIYEAGGEGDGDFTDMYNYMLTDDLARVFSTSWGCAEIYECNTGEMDSRHAIFNQMVGQGWTLVAAAGDSGAADDCYANNPAHTSVDYPASDPDVVGAGGTTLFLFSNGTYDTEVAWQGLTTPGACAKNQGGGGGGVSAYYSKPSYQSFKEGAKRFVPDISLNANFGQNYYFNGKLKGVGGTSIVAPELAGFFAQENAYLLVLTNNVGNTCGSGNPCAPMGNPNYYIYYEGTHPKYAPHYPFYDITQDCNSNDATIAGDLHFYCAGPGYDLVTGWGTANMLQLAWSINQWLAGDGGAPTVAFTGVAIDHWYGNSAHLGVTATDTTATKYPKNGVSGFSAMWDGDPGDVFSEPTPGTGNSFYSGPEFAGNTGSFPVSGGVNQGCHFMNVRAWDNAGQGSPDVQYGPVCYDSIAPVTSSGVSPAASSNGWNNTVETVTLSAYDPGASLGTGSGLYLTYAQTDKPSCVPSNVATCGAYVAPFLILTQGRHTVNYFSRDNAGNFEGLHTIDVNIDWTPPTTSILLGGTHVGSVFTGAAQVTFHEFDNLSGIAATYYQVNGGATQTYNGQPFTVAHLGTNTIKYRSVDRAGNYEAVNTVTFTEKEGR